MSRPIAAALKALALLLLALAPVQALAQKQPQPPLKVMSFNVRLPVAADGANAWEKRRDLAVAMIERAAPDIIGTQELWKVQGDYIVEKLPQYSWIGIDRRGGHADEHMGLFYRRDRLKLLDSGNFWLSDTPAVPGSISWDHPYPRMVTWARFETREGARRRFYAFNTHLPYRAGDEEARLKGAALLLERIRAMTDRAPVVLTGDFNTTPVSKVHAVLSTRLLDAWDHALEREGPEKTFHNFTGKPDRRIDWIFTRGLRADHVRTITDHDGALQTSDHFPVMAELSWY